MAEISNKNGNQHYPMRVEPVGASRKERKVKIKSHKPHRPKIGKYNCYDNNYSIVYDDVSDKFVCRIRLLEEYPIYMSKLIKKIDSGGRNAAIHGNSQEDMIASLLDGIVLQYPGISYKRFKFNYKSKPEKIFCKNAHGAVINPDFVVYGIPKYPHGLVISSKYQSVGGSGDEKLEHLFNDVTKYYPWNVRVLVVLEYIAANGGQPGIQRKLTIAENEFRDSVSEYKRNGGKMFVDIIKLTQLIRFFTEVMK